MQDKVSLMCEELENDKQKMKEESNILKQTLVRIVAWS